MKTSQLKTNKKKKVLSMLLALTMIFQISIPAVFAEGEENQKKIIAFEELADDVKNITVEVDSTEAELVAKMPSSLNTTYVKTTTGSALSITLENITWEIDEANSDSATFDSSQNGASYTYKAKLPATDSTGDELVLENGISLPTITVLVGAMPMLLGGGLDEASITDAGGNITTYATIEQALTAVQGMNGSTVTLLKDVATEMNVDINAGNFTIDLNGKTWTGPSEAETDGNTTFTFHIYGTPTMIIKDTKGNGKIISENQYKWVIVIFSSSSNIQLQGGSFSGVYTGGRSIASLLSPEYGFKKDGSWVIDTTVNNLTDFTVQQLPIKITDQPEDAHLAHGYTVDQVPTFSVTAQTVPTDSGETITYQWYKDDVVIDGATSSSYTVPIGLTEGTYSYYCIVTCEGVSVKSNNAALNIYIYSNTGDYEVTDSNSITSKYPTLEAAITFAKGKPGSTVKLLADANTASSVDVSSGTFTIDLNGHTWTSTASNSALNIINGSNVTLMDSATGGKVTTSTAQLTIRTSDANLIIKSGIYENENSSWTSYVLGAYSSGNITIEGGTIQTSKSKMYLVYLQSVNAVISGGNFIGSVTCFDGCNSIALSGGEYKSITTNNTSKVSNLLASGYGFKNKSDDTWVNNLGRDADLYNDLNNYSLTKPVTVETVPVAISQQPQNAANATYGYTQGPTISVTAQKTANGTGDISYKWYRVKSGSEIADMEEGTNSNTLEIPSGLPAGTHSFYCVVSCDGYILNTETVTFTVEKATPRVEIVEKNTSGRVFGDTIQIKAKVSGIYFENLAGTITLKEGSTTIATAILSNGSAILEWTNVPTGDHNLLVEYTAPSNSNYTDETSSNISFNVAKAHQALFEINEVTGKKFLDGNFTLGTTGGTGTGAVSYSASSNDVLSITGNTATITGAGTVIVTATKAEDENYLSATAQTVITIDKAPAPTLTFPTASGITYGQKLLDSILDGGSITLGSFSWRESEKDLVPNVNGGTNIAGVIFTPNATTVQNYEEISQVDREKNVSFSVNKAQPSINLSTRSTGVSGSRNAEITINLSKSGFGYYPQGTVKLVDCTEATEKDIVGAESIPLLGGEALYNWTGLSDKTYKVKAIYLGDENYLPASSSISEFDTTKNEQENFKLSNPGSKTYGDNAFTLTTSGGNGTGAVSYVSSDESIISISGDTATIHKAGTVSITATKAGDDNYNPAMHTLVVDVAKKALNIKADDKLNIVKGSNMPTLTYKVNGLLGTDSLTKEPVITTSAKDTNAVGEYVISISEAEVSNSDSYEISYTNGKMTVINSGSGNNGNNGDSGNNSGNGSSGGSSSKDDKDDKEQTKAPVNQTPTPQGELPLQTSEQDSTKVPVFTDTENHWAKEDIEFVTKRGLFGGTGDGKFSPNMPMTRGMFVTVLGKLAKADLTGFDSTDFKDVKSDAYYLPYIQWANTSGIVNGISSEEFAPDMEISREQMAVMLLNYIKAMNIDLAKLNEENQFADTDEMSIWAKEAVKAIQMSGILSGKPDNKFDPKGIATRAEVSSMLRRLIELIEGI